MTDSATHNRTVYQLSQACLGLIIDPIVSISFGFPSRSSVDVTITMIGSARGPEQAALDLLQTHIRQRLAGQRVHIELRSITAEAFEAYDYEVLDHVLFLRHALRPGKPRKEDGCRTT